MCDQFLTYSNLLVYLGFNVAAFAFISQYLSFPKDLLGELSRAKRNVRLHELPYNASRVTNNDITNRKASDKMKAFFLESDTIIYATLIYLLFSITLILLIIMVNLLKVDSLKTAIIFIGCTFLYTLLIVIPMALELFIRKKRKWPQKYQTAKKTYLIILMGFAFLLYISVNFSIHHHVSVNFSMHDHVYELLFILLIFGLLIHFLLYLLPIYSRMPVTHLLVLWENLRK